MALQISIAIYLLVLYQSRAEFTSYFLCNSSLQCYNDLLLCPTSSNCSVECSGSNSCHSAAINGYYANSLYLTSSDWSSARFASIYCPNNFQNGIIDHLDSYSDKNDSISTSRAIIDCTTKSGTTYMCRQTTFYCSNTDIIKIDCGESSTEYLECGYSDFYVSNVNEFEINIGAQRSCDNWRYYSFRL